MTLTTRVCYHITDFDRRTWNKLAFGSSVYYDYEWFQIVESTLGQVVYFAAYRAGDLVGVLPAFVVTDPQTYTYHNLRGPLFDRYDLDQLTHSLTSRWEIERLRGPLFALTDGLVRLNRGWLDRLFFPNLTFIAPVGYVSDVLLDASQADRSDIVRAIFAAVSDLSRQKHINTEGFLWLPARNDFLIRELQALGFDRIFADLEFNLPVAWSSFEEYLRSLKSKRRVQIKHEMEQARRQGVRISECHDFEALLGDLGQLGANLQAKYELYDYDRDALVERYRQVYDHFRGRARTFLAHRDERLVGFLMILTKNGLFYPKFTGFDYQACERTFTYFNLIFYHTLQVAIQAGATQVRYSMASGHAKLQRGCEKMAVYCFYRFKHAGVRRLLKPYLDWYNLVKTDYFDRMYPGPQASVHQLA